MLFRDIKYLNRPIFCDLSKAGGIGVAISHIRASGSYIRGTNGHSNGLVPMLRNFNETARYVDQGGGKRKGSFAMRLGRLGHGISGCPGKDGPCGFSASLKA